MVIEIAGSIASGKSTFARNCSQLEYVAEFEKFHNNPFWEDFYKNPAQFAFETELTFLLQHYNAIKKTYTFGKICYDFSLVQDLAYADINLTKERHDIFCKLLENLRQEVGFPRFIIHITCNEEELLRRISKRGREPELSITKNYLISLHSAIEKRVDDLRHYVDIIQVDSYKCDFRERFPASLRPLLLS